MTEANRAVGKTRWGCLSIPIVVTLLVVALFVWERIHDSWLEKQPLTFHLRNVFRESGFEVPGYVTDLKGSKGVVDSHGDFEASLTFTVRPEDIEKFLFLPKSHWREPADFKPSPSGGYIGGEDVPSGSFMIQEWLTHDYRRRYAVDKSSNRIYYWRSSS